MGWAASLLSAVIVGTIGAFAAFFTAYAAVDWLRIPAREGESGYFVVFMGLIGIVAGAAIGLIVGRIAGGPGLAGFGKGLGISVLVLLALVGGAGGYSWLLSDPWPSVDGHDVRVEFELRGHRSLVIDPSAPPVSSAGDGRIAVWLASHDSGSRFGTAQPSEARQDSGRWIVPGNLVLFTSRRSLYFGIRVEKVTAFIPFEAPRPLIAPDPQWSEWLTAAPDPAAPGETGPDGLAIRYRLTLEPEEKTQ